MGGVLAFHLRIFRSRPLTEEGTQLFEGESEPPEPKVLSGSPSEGPPNDLDGMTPVKGLLVSVSSAVWWAHA